MKSVYVRDELHCQLKIISAEEGVPLIDLLERLITAGLRDYRPQRRAEEKVREIDDRLLLGVGIIKIKDLEAES